jgi:hypothetical protein
MTDETNQTDETNESPKSNNTTIIIVFLAALMALLIGIAAMALFLFLRNDTQSPESGGEATAAAPPRRLSHWRLRWHQRRKAVYLRLSSSPLMAPSCALVREPITRPLVRLHLGPGAWS